VIISLAAVIVAVAAGAGDGVHWGYKGDHGPEHWAGLSPEFAICGSGLNQSPIEIGEATPAELASITLDYRGDTTRIVNNGHTLQVDVEPGSFLRVGEERFELQQFHFHSPSEHSIGGESFPFEAHLVHANARGALAVIGVVFRLGAEHAVLRKLGQAAPREKGGSTPLVLDLAGLRIHTVLDGYYRYSGSLTTPPCSEGVYWFLLKEYGELSAKQVVTFVELIGKDARGAQPRNARLVLER